MLSTRSEIEKVDPSASLTRAVSDLGPDSSTDTIDLAESRRITSNSELYICFYLYCCRVREIIIDTKHVKKVYTSHMHTKN